jgi:hypothetical protein
VGAKFRLSAFSIVLLAKWTVVSRPPRKSILKEGMAKFAIARRLAARGPLEAAFEKLFSNLKVMNWPL